MPRREIIKLDYIGSREWRAALKCGHTVTFVAKTSRTPYFAQCETCKKHSTNTEAKS